MIKNLYLDLSIPEWIFFVIFWILIVLAILYYTKTLPPLSQLRRIFLIILRSLVLIITVFLFLQPVVQFLFQSYRTPTIALLFDNSSSMSLEDRNGIRSDSVKYLLKTLNEKNIKDSLSLRKYKFDEDIGTLNNDSLQFSGEQTDISQALKTILDSLIQYNIQAIVLISDGQFNQGMNPLKDAKMSPIPIYSVPVGDSLPSKDIKISSIHMDRIAYSGEQVSVKVSIMQNGYDKKNMMVRLFEGKKQIAAKATDLPTSGFEKEVEFSFETKQSGEFRYVVEIDQLESELTKQNNRSSFLLNVMKSRMKVLLFSGQPTFDQQMLSYVLHQLPKIQSKTFTENNNGTFYESGFESIDTDSQDVYIFMGYPTERSNPAYIETLYSSINRKKIPIFINLTSRSSLRKLDELAPLLPFTKESVIIPQGNVNVSLTASGQLHPAVKVDDNPQKVLELWSDLPPVVGFGSRLKYADGTQILLQREGKNKNNNQPLILVANRQGVKSFILAATNVGNWHFQLQDTPDKERFFQDFIERSLRWLVNKEDLQRIQIFPDQKIYHLGERIQFSGQVYDEFYRRVKDAEVKITIQGKDFQQSDLLTVNGGIYFYRAVGVPPGVFQYQMTATRGEQLIGKVQGKLIVEELALESREKRADYSLMQQIAMDSGGDIWQVKKVVDRLNGLDIRKKLQIANIEYVVWTKSYWLFISIFLLTVEWFLRKRWGML